MGVSFAELKRRCQVPVRDKNDVAGLLFGDLASLPITKLFVDRRWSPNIATVGMLVCGLAGSLLQVFPAAIAVLGAALLLLYYVLDCVDGEVARYHGVEDIRWGYYDYLFHLLVKPLCFACVGIGAWRESASPVVLGLAGAAAIATLWMKIFPEIVGILFMKEVLSGSYTRKPAFRRFLEQEGLPDVEVGRQEPFRLGLDLGTLRAALTNFDMGLLYLLVATILDCFVGPIEVEAGMAFPLRALWLAWYGLVLPLDFLDHLWTYRPGIHFNASLRRLVAISDRFKVEPPGGAARETGGGAGAGVTEGTPAAIEGDGRDRTTAVKGEDATAEAEEERPGGNGSEPWPVTTEPEAASGTSVEPELDKGPIGASDGEMAAADAGEEKKGPAPFVKPPAGGRKRGPTRKKAGGVGSQGSPPASPAKKKVRKKPARKTTKKKTGRVEEKEKDQEKEEGA